MIVPDFVFITRILNIKESDIQSLDAVFRDNAAYYYLELKSSLKECPYCHGVLILHGHGRIKLINHASLSEYKSIIMYKPKRFICKECHKTITQDNPFTFARFKNS